jgi:calcium and integrin-binding protein 1
MCGLRMRRAYAELMPLAERLCEVFSSEPAFSPTWGDLNFDEYVDMYNCLSPDAPKDVKMKTAFRLYDFDGNGYLTTEDLEWLLRTIATPPGKKSGKPRNCLFEQPEINDIVERVMRDCDIDGNHRLSYAEFSKVLDRVPGFTNRFCIDIN